MINTENLTKLYYSIGEVADLFAVNASLIRFWEKEFKIIQPKKNKKGNRLFTPKDIENINKIYHLVKEKGYTLEGAKKALSIKNSSEKNEPSKDSTKEQLIYKLERIKERLNRLKS
jgi:DNA-binding transcriptional MerR regulator